MPDRPTRDNPPLSRASDIIRLFSTARRAFLVPWMKPLPILTEEA